MEKGASTMLILAGGIIVALAMIQMATSVKASVQTTSDGVSQRVNVALYGAPDANNTNFTYTFNDADKSATVTGLKRSATKVDIPDSVKSGNTIYNVTAIGYSAFDGKGLTSATLSQNLVTINAGAFAGNNISAVIIPSKVETIGAGAFTRNNMKSVQLGSSVKTVMSGAFADNQLTTLTLPNSVTELGGGAFVQNKLTEVEVPSAVENPQYAFDWNVKMAKQ